MEIIKGKKLYEVEPFSTLHEMLSQCVRRYPAQPAYMFRRAPGKKLQYRSYSEFLSDIEDLGTVLLAEGLSTTRIAVMGANSYEWAVSYNAVINGVGVVVPLDRNLPQDELIGLLKRARCRCLIFAPDMTQIALTAAENCPDVTHLICMDEAGRSPYDCPDLPDQLAQRCRLLLLSEMRRQGERLRAAGDQSFKEAVEAIDTEVMASLVFTSGTTAQSKGIMLSMTNLCSNVINACSSMRIKNGERCLSVLPLHHCFETTVGMYTLLYHGGCICFNDGLRYLAQNLVEWKINVILGVPLLFENIYKRIKDSINKSGKQGLVNVMRPIGRRLSRVGFQTNRRIFRSVLEGLGGELRMIVSGAAALNPEVCQAFLDFGVACYQGYGLSEASPVVSCNNEAVNDPATIGPPLYNVEVAIDNHKAGEVGEILTRSRSVMLGYYEAPELTRETIDADGWLHTGDMGYITGKGCIVVTGRCKSVIVLSNGKNVFPEELESQFSELEGVVEVMVFGMKNERGTVDVCVKFQVDAERLPEQARGSDEAIAAYLSNAVRSVNHKLSAYKAIKYSIFSEEPMVRTTTMKVKRYEEIRRMSEWLEQESLTMRKADGRRQG